MSDSSNESESAVLGPGLGAEAGAIDFGLVLVVGPSPVDRIVVSRIAEQAGFRTACRPPDEACACLSGRLSAMVIVDGGAQGREYEPLAQRLVDLRRPITDRRAPLVVLLGKAGAATPQQLRGRAVVDAVVTKPITPDRLQPVIQDMIEQLRQPSRD